MNMQGHWLELLTLIGVFGVAVLSPGPDFIVAVRNSLQHGRLSGIFTAIGFGFGVMVHVSYTLLGIAALIAKSILFFNVLKFAGAAYLIYMGVMALRSKGVQDDPLTAQTVQEKIPFTPWQSLRSGFVTNVLNPKASLFFLALFTQIVRPETPPAIQAIFGISCALLVVTWFSIVAFILTTAKIRAKFLRASQWIDRVCGTVFIGLGLKLALTKAPV